MLGGVGNGITICRSWYSFYTKVTMDGYDIHCHCKQKRSGYNRKAVTSSDVLVEVANA
jgi:hypothetical protein